MLLRALLITLCVVELPYVVRARFGMGLGLIGLRRFGYGRLGRGGWGRPYDRGYGYSQPYGSGYGWSQPHGGGYGWSQPYGGYGGSWYT
ncbi:hypothetical protein RB195_015652 [Necator americanus]|uniref:Uncharacterized protein n=1 Tax=Necator americanus TaxID=51031 RepID=A0ABR1E887_NECAM